MKNWELEELKEIQELIEKLNEKDNASCCALGYDYDIIVEEIEYLKYKLINKMKEFIAKERDL